MTDERPKEPVLPANVQGEVTPKPPAETAANTPGLGEQSDPGKLTAEEQMAQFEKELKENDWGHQPC